jgi:hypothetical protein
MDESKFSGRENDDTVPLKRGRRTDESKVIVAVSFAENGKPFYARMQVVENFKAKTI